MEAQNTPPMPDFLSSQTPSAAAAAGQPPVHAEFISLPSRGGDSVCGLSRSWWYLADKNGLIQLVRIRQRGAKRGRVLLPVDQAIALVRKLGAQAAADITVAANAARVTRAIGNSGAAPSHDE